MSRYIVLLATARLGEGISEEMFINFQPILSMSTFLKVTGPKTDLWLVKTVGRDHPGRDWGSIHLRPRQRSDQLIDRLLGKGSALSLAIVEIVYVAKRVISPIYLGDAFIELLLIAWWVLDIVFF